MQEVYLNSVFLLFVFVDQRRELFVIESDFFFPLASFFEQILNLLHGIILGSNDEKLLIFSLCRFEIRNGLFETLYFLL